MKKLMYYVYCPGVLFKAVLIKTIKLPLIGTIHCVLYRNDIYDRCYTSWIIDDSLFDELLIERKLIDA
jgi:hypothetical protein